MCLLTTASYLSQLPPGFFVITPVPALLIFSEICESGKLLRILVYVKTPSPHFQPLLTVWLGIESWVQSYFVLVLERHHSLISSLHFC